MLRPLAAPKACAPAACCKACAPASCCEPRPAARSVAIIGTLGPAGRRLAAPRLLCSGVLCCGSAAAAARPRQRLRLRLRPPAPAPPAPGSGPEVDLSVPDLTGMSPGDRSAFERHPDSDSPYVSGPALLVSVIRVRESQAGPASCRSGFFSIVPFPIESLATSESTVFGKKCGLGKIFGRRLCVGSLVRQVCSRGFSGKGGSYASHSIGSGRCCGPVGRRRMHDVLSSL